VRIWDYPHVTGGPVVLRAHADSLTGLDLDPADPAKILTASLDGTARIWSGTRPHELRGHGYDELRSARWSTDGRFVVTASNDMTARVWDAATGEKVAVLGSLRPDSASQASDPLRGGVVSPDRTTMVVADGNAARIERVGSPGGDARKLTGHTQPITSAAFRGDGLKVVTADAGGNVRVWDAASGSCEAVLPTRAGPISAVTFSPAGNRVAAAAADGTARLWDTSSWQELRALEHAEPLAGVAFDAAGDRVVTVTAQGRVTTWEVSDPNSGNWKSVEAPQSVAAPAGHRKRVYTASFSPDGTRILTGSADETARIWAWSRGSASCEFVLRGHHGGVRTAAYDRTGATVLTVGDADLDARLWNAADGRLLHVLAGHDGPLTSASFDAEGTHVLTASRDGTARVWNVAGEQFGSDEADLSHGHDGRERRDLPFVLHGIDQEMVCPEICVTSPSWLLGWRGC
jgi:WD40 repeat protein